MLYTAAGCHLCDAARRTVYAVRDERGFDLREVDITSDDELHRRFLERIPVIALDGEEIYDFEVDEADLARRLDQPSYSDLRRIE